jgi:hypothetical protein
MALMMCFCLASLQRRLGKPPRREHKSGADCPPPVCPFLSNGKENNKTCKIYGGGPKNLGESVPHVVSIFSVKKLVRIDQLFPVV